jgi:hypothetical protein
MKKLLLVAFAALALAAGPASAKTVTVTTGPTTYTPRFHGAYTIAKTPVTETTVSQHGSKTTVRHYNIVVRTAN